MKKAVAGIYLVAILAGAYSLRAQTPSTLDAIQNMEITTTEEDVKANRERIDSLEMAVDDLKGAVREAKAWVIGFGAGISGLQILQMVGGRKNRGPNLQSRY